MRKILASVFIFCIIGLTGCASTADSNGMMYVYQSPQTIKSTQLKNNISVAEVMGGQKTNPLWVSKIDNANFKAALKKSLASSSLFHDLQGAKYILTADLIKLQQPLLGLNLTVNCEVHYSIKNAMHKKVYDKNISSTYTAKFGDSLLAFERLRLANEGAARENIKLLIKDIYNLSV